MDNFMDKLAKRFSAGEMIKANQAAEERELKRAKEQAAENEKLLQEIRRLNLKNVELSEQVGQLIQCGIEQLEEYDKAADKAQEDYQEYGKEIKKTLSDMEAAILEISGQISQMKETEETDLFRTGMESLKTDLEKAGQEQKTELASVKNQMQKTEEEQKSQFVSIKNQMDKVVETSMGIPGKIIDARVALQGEIRNVKEAVAAVDAKLAKENNQDEFFEKIQESIQDEKAVLEKAIKALEEYVHKENVKVYRNVQAVVVDQTTAKTRELGDRLDALERNAKKSKGLMPLALFTLLAAVASLLLQLAQMFSLL